MSTLQKKLRNIPHNLSFECDLWAWLQSKRRHDGMMIPLSAVITKYLSDAIAKDPVKKPSKSIERKYLSNKIAKKSAKKSSKSIETNDVKAHWKLEVNDKTPAWVRNIVKQLDATR